MAKKGGLGRGLEALLGDISEPEKSAAKSSEKKEQNGLMEISISLIDTNAKQPRKSFSEEALAELAQSIGHSGIIQPLVVRPNGKRYTLIAGERRWRAARMAGLKKVPVIIREYQDDQLMEIALVENLQREDLNPVEEAAGIKLLMQEHDLTQEEVASRLGKSRPAIANAVRLLNLPEPVLELVRKGALSAGHARCLVALGQEEKQLRAAQYIVEKQLSVRQAEALCKSMAKEEQTPKPRRQELLPELEDIRSQLQDSLETKVRLTGTAQKGKIVIEYYSDDQLERLYEFLSRKSI